MNDNSQRMLDDAYKNILEKIRGGTIYGIIMDEYNIKQVAVSAYMLGLLEGQNAMKDFEANFREWRTKNEVKGN